MPMPWPHGNPIKVFGHDFPLKELGEVTPFRVYNIFKNQDFVSVGISCDTAVFAVKSIRKWWCIQSVKTYSTDNEIVITVDCGGSNGYRNRLWKHELQKFSNEVGKKMTVLHYPPETSKWNKIDHRLFGFISRNWVAGEKCCSPNNSLKEPKVNNQSNNDFMHSMVFGKTHAFSH
jgi:hypothetical protein